LTDLGFVWPIRVTDDWDRRFEQLRAFQKEHGHCQVAPTEGSPALSGRRGKDCKDSDTHGLFLWVNAQRKRTMTEDRMQKLNDIGFEWVLRKPQPWDERLEELKASHKEHGHIRVPIRSTSKDSDTHLLHLWVSYQQRSTSILEERIQKLNALGFEWVLQKRGTPPGMKDSTQRPFRRSTGT
jgi:hypothetical protein